MRKRLINELQRDGNVYILRLIEYMPVSFFSRHLFADVIRLHNENMKQARAIEFNYTNLLAMLNTALCFTSKACM